MGLVRLELTVVRVLDEYIAATQLGRGAAAKVVDHRDGRRLFRHLQERLTERKMGSVRITGLQQLK